MFASWQGGMKAVIWTDVFQSAVMIAGMLSIVIQVGILIASVAFIIHYYTLQIQCLQQLTTSFYP